MAKIKLKICLILQRSENDASNIYLDTLDYRDKGGMVNVPDEAILFHIKCGGDKMYKRKTWENAFEIINFEDPEIQENNEYLLQGSKPLVDYKESTYDGLGLGKVNFLKNIKGNVSPEGILVLDYEEAVNELIKKYNLRDVDFLKQVRKELESYRDEALEEIVHDLISDIEENRDLVEYTENFLMKKGARFLQSLAESLNVKSSAKIKTKKEKVVAIIKANESLKKKRQRTQLLKK